KCSLRKSLPQHHHPCAKGFAHPDARHISTVLKQRKSSPYCGCLTTAVNTQRGEKRLKFTSYSQLIGRSRHILYANATVLSTQGACRETGGVNGVDALQGGRDDNGMGEAGRWGLLMMRQSTATPIWGFNTLFQSCYHRLNRCVYAEVEPRRCRRNYGGAPGPGMKDEQGSVTSGGVTVCDRGPTKHTHHLWLPAPRWWRRACDIL
ncbi:hypothetical protein KUCAC02_005311, partial [Chaenocephalus aceratus]